MDFIFYSWPWGGLGLAAPLLVWLLREPRPAGAPPRWRDPAFLLALLWPMYLLHQFEEHGVDLLGQRYAFLAALCRTLGHVDLASCPADAPFIFSVNVIGCPLGFMLPLWFRRTRPLVAAFGWSIPLTNAFTHIGGAIATRAYNPGLLTSLVLFLPLGFWLVRTMLRAGQLLPAQVPLLFVAGGLVHAVLVGSLLAREHGVIGHGSLLLINALNGLVPLAVGLAVASMAARRARTAAAPAARGGP